MNIKHHSQEITSNIQTIASSMQSPIFLGAWIYDKKQKHFQSESYTTYKGKNTLNQQDVYIQKIKAHSDLKSQPNEILAYLNESYSDSSNQKNPIEHIYLNNTLYIITKLQQDLIFPTNQNKPEPPPITSSKYLYTIMPGSIHKISIKKQQLLEIHICQNDFIGTATSTPNCKYLFTCNWEGVLQQYTLSTYKLIHNYGQIHQGEIQSIIATSDSKYLFTSDSYGHVKQFNISEKKLVKDYGKIHEGSIFSITVTNDNEYMFTSDNKGILYKWSIDSYKLINNFGKILDGIILIIKTTNDSNFLYVCNNKGYMKKFDIRSCELTKDFGKIHKGMILSLAVTVNNSSLFTSDTSGELKEWDIQTNLLKKDFGEIHTGHIFSIMITICGKWLFTSDHKGHLKQWDICKHSLVKNYEAITHNINALIIP